MIGLSRRRTMGGNVQPTIIMDSTTNPEVLAICYAQGWCASQNYMTLEEAQAVTDIGTVFGSSKTITHFEELKYFGITSLAQRSFQAASNLTSIEVPDALTSIGTYSFVNASKLQSFHIKNNIQAFGDYTFGNYTTSINVVFDSLYNRVAGKLNYRKGIKYESNVYTVVNGVMYDSSDMLLMAVEPLNTNPIIPNNILTIGNYALYYNTASSISIPNTVTTIGKYGFAYSKITSVDIPNSVTKIDSYAFREITTLISIRIPSSVVTFGSEPFYGTNNVQSIYTDSPRNINSLERGFSRCTTLDSSVYDVINSNTLIKDSNILFTVARGISGTYTIPNNITQIGASAFTQCYNITDVSIPSSVTTILNTAFLNCTALTSINIPDSVTSIGVNAFNGCNSLTTVVIGSGTSSILGSAFLNCTSLTSVTINRTTPPTLGNNDVFRNTNNCPIYVPASSVETYKTASTAWRNLASRIQAIQT